MSAPIRNVRFDVSTESGMSSFLAVVHAARLSGKSVVVEIVEASCSTAQFNALHLWCGMVADCLNASGLDMRRGIREDVDIPWTKESVKQNIWKPLQLVMTGKESTKKGGKLEYPEISETIVRHFAKKGVQLPAWPQRHVTGWQT